MVISITLFYFFFFFSIHNKKSSSKAHLLVLEPFFQSFVLFAVVYSMLIEESGPSCVWNPESCRGGISMCQVEYPGDICLRTMQVFRAPQSLSQWPQFPLHPGAGPLPLHSPAEKVPAARQDFWSRVAEAVFAEQQLKSAAVLYQGWHNMSSLFFPVAGFSTGPGCPSLVFQRQARALALSPC